jgi:hypothetical protein
MHSRQPSSRGILTSSMTSGLLMILTTRGKKIRMDLGSNGGVADSRQAAALSIHTSEKHLARPQNRFL